MILFLCKKTKGNSCNEVKLAYKIFIRQFLLDNINTCQSLRAAVIILLLPAYRLSSKLLYFVRIITEEILKKRLSSHTPIANCCYSTGYYSKHINTKHINTNRESFLIKCLQTLPNFAYIWGISLRLLDLACPIEVGRPYLHLLADH